MRKHTLQPAALPRVDNLATRVRRRLELGLDLVFPPVCAHCHTGIESGLPAAVCRACRAELVELRPACPRCGALVAAASTADRCGHCRNRNFHFQRIIRLGTYQGALRGAVLRTKRPHALALAAALSELLVESAGSDLAELNPDVVVPVPMHWTRKMWRDTNSPDVVARRLAGHLKAPVRSHLLVRRRRTAPQAALSHARRRANVRGAFRASAHPDLPGSRILLVDDIMTSGATVDEAAKVLRKAGARFVAVAVLARAEGHV